MPMRRLAALQLENTGTRVQRWAEAGPEAFREWTRRLDPSGDYDPALHRLIVKRTIEEIGGLLEGAGERGVDLVLLPEMTLPVESLLRPSARELMKEICAWCVPEYLERAGAAARKYGMAVASCLYRTDEERIYNSGILTDETGAVAGVYDKVHLPCPAVVEPETVTEAGFAEAGKSFAVFECRAGRVGFMICYDIDFPESAACLALNGAEILLHPTVGYNFPDEEESMGEARLRTRAVDTMRPLVYANFGKTPGCSCVITHSGAVAAKIGREAPALAVADVAVGEPRGVGMFWPGYEHRGTILRKRRPDAYGVLTQPVPPVLEGEQQPGTPLYDYLPEVGLP
ncbi:MAG: carbon-nitrogen hydrolase family protein [Armatimonadetes bacterium]|nr:carbon-nitrogen hydrolase family protein [Armatimonadota bacterium]